MTQSASSKLYIARSWMERWDAEAAQTCLEKFPDNVFFIRNQGAYAPAESFHFDTLILGGKFPGALDSLGGLDKKSVAVMDILDPGAEHITNVHLEGVSQILIDINGDIRKEAEYLRGSGGLKRVVQSNIGGPNDNIPDLESMAKSWWDGEPGCNCLICCRVPKVLEKLQCQACLSPMDVLPITTIPNLAHVVDELLRPSVKIVLGSQGFIKEDEEGKKFQEYPSAAVGFLNYPEVSEVAQVSRKGGVHESLDPKGVFKQNRAPEGYRYVYGMFWENGVDMKRPDDDPDRHAFGFVFVKKSANLSDQEIKDEMYRYQPNPVPKEPAAAPALLSLKRASSLDSVWCCLRMAGRDARAELRYPDAFNFPEALGRASTH